MKVSQINKNNNPNFGMKFSFIKKSQNGDWQKAQRCFFHDAELAVIRRRVESLEPKTDEFILTLDLPTFKIEKDSQNNYYFNKSYEMGVCLKDEKGESKNIDLSVTDIKLKLFDPKQTIISHPKSPFIKLWDFVEILASRNGTK